MRHTRPDLANERSSIPSHSNNSTGMCTTGTAPATQIRCSRCGWTTTESMETASFTGLMTLVQVSSSSPSHVSPYPSQWSANSHSHAFLEGPGTVARRLGTHFDRILVSDAGRGNILSAQNNLASPSTPELLVESSKYVFCHSPAESVHASVPPSSIDFACVAMAFHYFDADAAIRSIAAMLKPGGTLATVTYGFRLKFPGRPELERLWYRAASKESLRLIREGLFPTAVRGLANAMSGLDFVPLPTDLFKPGARRIQVNVEENEQRPLYFVDEDRCWESAQSRVSPTDMRRFVKDESWRREADIEWLRGFLASCKMGFGQKTWEIDEWRELETLVRSAGGKVVVEWPVAMILATRTDKPVTW